MSETRKLTTILAADVAGYSRLVGADEEGTVARLRALQHELIDPVVTANKGRIVKTTGDGRIIEFASVVDAVRCAIEVQRKMALRNSDVVPDKRIEFRVGIHLGDVIVESDGDLMGDGVNIAARLEGIAESGGICMSNAAYEQVRDKITADFIDLGERELKNIARPVRAYAVPPPSTHYAPMKQERRSDDKGGPPRLSIVVLPFANIGSDPEQEYFVDGVTESLTTDLSRISGSFVIARNTAFTYKGKHVDVKQIGRELNVRYALEGSVQRGGNRLRINVQLIDAETGNHLWAERFDKPVADLFDMQDEIVARLANTLNTELITAEARRTKGLRDNELSSFELAMRGWSMVNQHSSVDVDSARAVRSIFEDAIRLDQSNVDALCGLGRSYIVELFNFASPSRAEAMAKAEAALSGALAIAPNNARVRQEIAELRRAQGDTDGSLREFHAAQKLDRNYAEAYGRSVFAEIYAGRAERAAALVEMAIRLSPRDPSLGIWHFGAGVADFCLGRMDNAIDGLRKAIEAVPSYGLAHYYLAAAYATTDRPDDAARALADGKRFLPEFTIKKYASQLMSHNPTYVAQRETFLAGFRKVGVPEG